MVNILGTSSWGRQATQIPFSRLHFARYLAWNVTWKHPPPGSNLPPLPTKLNLILNTGGMMMLHNTVE